MARILVVDDHPHIVRLVRRELERDAHEVLTAADGEEALRLAREQQPAVIVLDVVMPRRNGFEVLRELKADPAKRPEARGTAALVICSWVSPTPAKVAAKCALL
jgi:CheY-like chemotaxis protein